MKKYINSSITQGTLPDASVYLDRIATAEDAAAPHLKYALHKLSESIEGLYGNNSVAELDGNLMDKDDLEAGLYNIQNAKRCIADALEYIQK